METRRVTLSCGLECAEDLSETARRLNDGIYPSRTCRIIFAGQPVALIAERFPRAG